jgi:hypothetical protein
MKKLGKNIEYLIADLAGDSSKARLHYRTRQVRERYRQVLESVYNEMAAYFLEHTNNVFILREGDARTLRSDHDDRKDAGATGKGKQLVVYVDESIVAAELNARRELVKLQFFERFGEEIDEFKIFISRGQYKSFHPFVRQEQAPSYEERATPVPLSDDELVAISEQTASIDNAHLRKAVQRAMVADLEWKRGLSGQTKTEQPGKSNSPE